MVAPILLRVGFVLTRPLFIGALHLLGVDAKEKMIGTMQELALRIQRNSDRRVPVEYGYLRGSSYVEQELTSGKAGTWGEKSTWEVGYTAHYAVYVHENLEMKWRGKPRASGIGVYWGPRGESKFLEKAFSEEVEKTKMSTVMKTHLKNSALRMGFGS
jgi:hypothetical protein